MDDDAAPDDPGRCVIVVDAALPVGRAANAAADLVDKSGVAHPGLIPIGIAVLAAPAEELSALRAKALARGIDVVDFPVQGQETTDYAAFGSAVGEVETEALRYVGVGVFGPGKSVGKVVGKFGLLR